MLKRLNQIPVYPFLIAIFPVLALLGNNINEISPDLALRSIGFSLALCAGLLLFFRLILQTSGASHMAAGVSLIIFYSYGHVYQLFHDRDGVVGILGRHRYLLPLAAAIILLSIIMIHKVRHPESQIPALNLLGLLLLIFPSVQILSYVAGREVAQAGMARKTEERNQLELRLEKISEPPPGRTPDIYYIVLDAYGRSDALEQHLNFDNSAFLDGLRELDFSIAGCSQSNYSSTILSLPSTLNMMYVDGLLGEGGQATVPVMVKLSKDNLVRRTLEGSGYQVVSFEGGYSVSEWEDADHYYDLPTSPLRLLHGLNEFESLLLDTTMIRITRDLEDGLPFELPTFLDYAYFKHRRQILNVLDHLPEISENPAPTFTIAHVLAPHEPFVFDANGEHVTQTKTFTLKPDILREDKPAYMRGYSEQIQYINDRVLGIVRQLLANSSEAPIIIIQGDHGPKRNMSSNVARLAILNAYYLPGADPDLIYPAITPVNSFRLLLNTYFDADLPILPDEAYLSTHNDLLDFWPVGEIYWPCRDRLQ